ncbi:MAG: Na+/H+ antiporter NhaA [Kistimonas sp.]|nr:Na+/H+ antiporter NhaA [Kistimonas sp.]
MTVTKTGTVVQVFRRLMASSDSAAGLALMAAAALALLVANIPGLDRCYDLLLSVPITVAAGSFAISKPLLLWVNDGLMALFFLLVGLELKRECLYGSLSSPRHMILPASAAFGGMLVPALFYVAFNTDDPLALRGWAIPTATDIAFSLGILALLGSRIPPALKVFLMALAIIDDLGAVLVIALFYTSELSALSAVLALLCMAVLILMNRRGVQRLAPFVLVGIIMWACVLKSGVHATLAGVALALAIPARPLGQEPSLLQRLEKGLHSWVSFLVLPLFAFANAGVELDGKALHQLLEPSPLGVIVGLFIGKQVGVSLFSWLAVRWGSARLPTGVSWWHIYGTAVLCGIGFTMSLFIGSLAFDPQDGDYLIANRTAVILASFLAAILGYIVLRLQPPRSSVTDNAGTDP